MRNKIKHRQKVQDREISDTLSCTFAGVRFYISFFFSLAIHSHLTTSCFGSCDGSYFQPVRSLLNLEVSKSNTYWELLSDLSIYQTVLHKNKNKNLLLPIKGPQGTNNLIEWLKWLETYKDTCKHTQKPGKHIYVQWLHGQIRAYQIPP